MWARVPTSGRQRRRDELRATKLVGPYVEHVVTQPLGRASTHEHARAGVLDHRVTGFGRADSTYLETFADKTPGADPEPG